MKQVLNGMTLKTFMTFSFAMMVHTILLAQDGGGSGSGSGGTSGSGSSESTTSVTRTTTTTEWYTSPWVWVIGIAVFVLLLVALLRGGGSDRTTTGRTDKVVVTKTSSTDI